MKTNYIFTPVIAASLLFTACDARVETAPPVVEKVEKKDTTIVNPPATEKKVENNTTIVNPPAEKK